MSVLVHDNMVLNVSLKRAVLAGLWKGKLSHRSMVNLVTECTFVSLTKLLLFSPAVAATNPENAVVQDNSWIVTNIAEV